MKNISDLLKSLGEDPDQYDLTLLKKEILTALQKYKYQNEFKISYIFESGDTIKNKVKNYEFSNRISQILNFVENKHTQKIYVKDAANHIYISEYHFGRVFKSEIGISFIKHLNLFRLLKAAHLLKINKSDDSITEISFKVGFNDLSNFIKQFNKYIGCSPSNFRKCNNDFRLCKFRQGSYLFKKRSELEILNDYYGFTLSNICHKNSIISKIFSK